MIGGIFSFLGAALKALPLVFSFMAGRNQAALIAALALLLSGCGSAAFETGSCPRWPEAGPLVAEEGERGMMPADQFPAFWEWMWRADKLRDQLLEC